VIGCTSVENPNTGQRTIEAASVSAESSTGSQFVIEPETSR
jgi:hypothetical protein